jgi:hypothetical protein
MSNLNEEQFGDYRMQHQADPDGAQLHDAESAYPDIHQHPEYYHHGSKAYDESLRVVRSVKGKPDAQVNIYRAVPHGVKDINPGDWVSTSKTYATQHGMQDDPKDDWPVISRKVPAKHLRTDGGNDVNEWGYFPEDKR